MVAIVGGRVHFKICGHDLCEELALCCGRVVDFVRIDFFVEGFANSQVEPFEELGQRFAFVTNQHGQAPMGVVCKGDTAHRPDRADGDLAMPDQLSDAGQRR